MTTVVVQIGNTDNKLSQRTWSKFIEELTETIENCGTEGGEIHFAGGSSAEKSWQNYCWVCSLETEDIFGFVKTLKVLKEKFQQNSIAVCVGESEFV